jgi:acetyl esterase/lipase
MLAAYTFGKKDFTPPDLLEKDLSVRAVISLYGSSDMEAIYYHTNQHLTMRGIPGQPKKKVPTEMPRWIKKKMGADFHRLGMDKGFVNAGAIPPLLGGYPDECPQTYKLFTVATHVHPGCPPTLLIHGEHDIMAPVKSTEELYKHLVKAGVPAILHLIPQTDHAFDMPFPKISPSVHNVIYDVERFLALHAAMHEINEEENEFFNAEERELSLI